MGTAVSSLSEEELREVSNTYSHYSKQDILLLYSEFRTLAEFDRTTCTFAIKRDTFDQLLSKIGDSQLPSVQRLFAVFDFNQDGFMDFTEYLMFTSVFAHGSWRDQCEGKPTCFPISFYRVVIFRIWDLDNNGVISLPELHATFDSTGTDANLIASIFDENHDGVISYEEFMKVMDTERAMHTFGFQHAHSTAAIGEGIRTFQTHHVMEPVRLHKHQDSAPEGAFPPVLATETDAQPISPATASPATTPRRGAARHQAPALHGLTPHKERTHLVPPLHAAYFRAGLRLPRTVSMNVKFV